MKLIHKEHILQNNVSIGILHNHKGFDSIGFTYSSCVLCTFRGSMKWFTFTCSV